MLEVAETATITRHMSMSVNRGVVQACAGCSCRACVCARCQLATSRPLNMCGTNRHIAAPRNEVRSGEDETDPARLLVDGHALRTAWSGALH